MSKLVIDLEKWAVAKRQLAIAELARVVPMPPQEVVRLANEFVGILDNPARSTCHCTRSKN